MSQRFKTYTKLFLAFGLAITLSFSQLFYYSAEAKITLLVVLGISLCLWLTLSQQHTAIQVMTTPLDISIWLILGAIVTAATLSQNPGLSWRITGGWIVAISCFYLTLLLIRQNIITTSWVLSLLGGVCLIFVVAGYFEIAQKWLTWRESASLKPFSRGLIHGLNESQTILVLLVVWFLLICIGRLGAPPASKNTQFIYLAGSIFALPLMYFANSSGGWIALITGSTIIAIGYTHSIWMPLWNRFSSSQKSKLIWAIGLSGTLLIMGIIGAIIQFEIPLSGRTRLWQIALTMWSEQILFGNGLGTFITGFIPNPTQNFHRRLLFHAHSFWFGSLAEIGLIGTLAHIALLGQIVWLMIRHKQRLIEPHILILLACLAAFLIHALVEMPRYRHWLVIYTLLAAFVNELVPIPNKSTTSYYRGRINLYVWPLIGILICVAMWHDRTIHQQFEAGILFAEEGDWANAVTQFKTAHEAAWLTDTAVLYALAYSQAHLDLSSRSTSNKAITSYYEELILREPSWPIYKLHLGLLHWHNGNLTQAENALIQAASFGDPTTYFSLTLAQFYEHTNRINLAHDTYQNIYKIDTAWHTAPIWSELNDIPTTPSCIGPKCETPEASMLQSAWDELVQGEKERAQSRFEQLATDSEFHDDPAVILGLHLSQSPLALNLSNEQLIQSLSQTRSDFFYIHIADLFILEGLDADILQRQLTTVLDHSAQGYFQKQQTISNRPYARLAFLRNNISNELLPIVPCFAFDKTLAWQINTLEAWYEQNGRDDLSIIITKARAGTDGSGIRPCTNPFTHNDN